MTKFDHNTATGNILFWEMPGWYRLMSRVFCFVERLDFENGLDLFVPTNATDAELGTAIRKCHDASRKVAVKDLPRTKGAAKDRALYSKWEKIGLDKVGVKRFCDFSDSFSAVISKRNGDIYFFSNFWEREKGDSRQALSKDSVYREFLVSRNAPDEGIGKTAREALAAIVRYPDRI